MSACLSSPSCCHRNTPAQSTKTNLLRSSLKLGPRQATARQVSMKSSQKKDVSGRDLLIVGPGVLGGYLGKLWKDQYPDARVVGQSNTTNSHASLKKLGMEARTNEEADDTLFPFVAFSAPPSGSTDYAASVELAKSRWDGTGTLIFTGSAGVYAAKEGVCKEDSPVAEKGESDRQDRLLSAEAAVRPEGNVVRLVGLYHSNRGAHTAFLKMGTVQRPGDSLINLIHYEDAARLAFAVLDGQNGGDEFYRGQTFVGSDNHPVSYQEMVDKCKRSGVYEGDVTFTGEPGIKGKTMDTSVTNERLDWKPKYSSFGSFITDFKGQDFYSTFSSEGE